MEGNDLTQLRFINDMLSDRQTALAQERAVINRTYEAVRVQRQLVVAEIGELLIKESYGGNPDTA